MKLSQINYQTSKPSKIEIKDHNGQSFDKPAFISVLSSESKEAMEAKLNLMRSMANSTKDDEGNVDEKAIYNLSCDALASITVGWENIEDDEGNAIEFSHEQCADIYKNFPYIFNIVNEFSGNLGNFLAKQEKNL